MLCAQPAPWGPFYVWIENEILRHGSLAGDTLRQVLPPDSVFAPTILALPAPTQTTAAEPPVDTLTELRDVLNRMLIERIKGQETEAIEASGHDPQALARYRGLQTRRRQLELLVAQAVQSAR